MQSKINANRIIKLASKSLNKISVDEVTSLIYDYLLEVKNKDKQELLIFLEVVSSFYGMGELVFMYKWIIREMCEKYNIVILSNGEEIIKAYINK